MTFGVLNALQRFKSQPPNRGTMANPIHQATKRRGAFRIFMKATVAALIAFALVGCSMSPVSGDLDEDEANRIIVALDRLRIAAEKEPDPGVEGRFRVVVARDDAVRSLSGMRELDLPRSRSTGVLDTLDKGALVPSQSAEHARLVAGLAGDLERTLVAVDGILAARVHLNLPTVEPFAAAVPTPKATASVLVEHAGMHAPISTEDVQRLVAGAVGGLTPNEVQTIFIARPVLSGAMPASQFAHVGPILVATNSARPLQFFVCLAIALFVALGGALIILRLKLVGTREKLAEALGAENEGVA